MSSVEVQFPLPVVGPSRTLSHYTDQAAHSRFAEAYRKAANTLPTADARTLGISAGQVRCYRFGACAESESEEDQAPILLLSGRNASTPMWSPALGNLLTLGRPIYSIDGVGEAGCSVQSTPFESGDDQAKWVADVIEELRFDTVHLVGHSLGGWLAVQVALRHPDLVKSVTALDPPATFTRLSVRFALAGLVTTIGIVPNSWRRRLLGWIAGGPITDSDPLSQLGWVGLQTFRVRQPPPARPSLDELAKLGVPMLAILAGQSRVHNPQVAARSASTIPSSQAELWASAGHNLHASHPERLAQVLGQFIEAVDR